MLNFKMSLQMVKRKSGFSKKQSKVFFQNTLAGGVKRWSCISRKTSCKAYTKIDGKDNFT